MRTSAAILALSLLLCSCKLQDLYDSPDISFIGDPVTAVKQDPAVPLTSCSQGRRDGLTEDTWHCMSPCEGGECVTTVRRRLFDGRHCDVIITLPGDWTEKREYRGSGLGVIRRTTSVDLKTGKKQWTAIEDGLDPSTCHYIVEDAKRASR